jgi:CBS domain-containing protein
MLARDLMTKPVVTVSPDTPVNEVARILLDHGIGAAPVVDAAGVAIGMVSGGALVGRDGGGRDDGEHEARRDSWLMLLAGGEKFQQNFLQGLRQPQCSARDVMGAPVVSVAETTEAEEIARVLTTCCIKRVPVVRDSRVVGIVSRADLVRMLGAGQSRSSSVKNQDRQQGMIAGLVTAIEDHFDHRDGICAGSAG